MTSEPPFEDVYRDHAIYLRALLGEEVDAAVEYFRRKIDDQTDPMRAIQSAQVLVGLLVRRARPIGLPRPFSALPIGRRCPASEEISTRAGRLTKFRRWRRSDVTVTVHLA